MAKSNPTSKCSWKTGVIYAVVIAAVTVAVIYNGLYYFMPLELIVQINGSPHKVLFTDDFYNRSMQLMMVSVVFPVVSYLLMYAKYRRLYGENTELKEKVKKSKVWIPFFIVQLVLTALWGIVSLSMIAWGLSLDVSLPADAIMLRQYFLVYMIVMVVGAVLYILGMLLFKPAEVQRA